MNRNPLMDSYANMVKFCPEARVAETVRMTRTAPIDGTDMNLTVSSQLAGTSSILVSSDVRDELEPLSIPLRATGDHDEGIAVIVQAFAPDFVTTELDIVSASLHQLGMTLEKQEDDSTSTLGTILRSLSETRPGRIEQRPNYISFTSSSTLVYDNRLLAAKAIHQNILDHVEKPTSIYTTDHNVFAAGFNKYGAPFILDAVETDVEQGYDKFSTLSILAHTPHSTTSFILDSTTGDTQARTKILRQPVYKRLADPTGIYAREELIEADAETNAKASGDPPTMIESSKDVAARRLGRFFADVYEVSSDPYALFGTK